MSLVPQKLRIPKRKRTEIEERFQRDGALTARKLREYVPTMLVNNLSVLLLITVDGLVLGNLVGPKALSAVNIFYPATVLIGVASVLVSSGAATSISIAMGKSDYDALRRAKSATKRAMVVAALLMAVIQIPLVTGIIASYPLDDYMTALTWEYALCIMIATPFDLISGVGTLQLQATGKMRWLMSLTIMEGIVNLALDLLFVGPMNMGAMGAGLGTACANILRCTATVIVLAKTTDVYKTGGVKADRAAYKDLLSYGVPDAANAFMLALQNYLMMQVVIMVFGAADGGAIKGVCVFCFGIANLMIGGIQSSMRPLVGIITGGGDWDGLRILFRQCMKLLVATVGIVTVIVIAFPSWFYTLHGVNDIPTAGELSLRLFALHFVFKGCNTLFRLYYANRKDPKFATGVTVVGNATLPLFAFLLSMVFPPAFVWLGYLFTELVILMLNLWRYKRWVLKDLDEEERLVGAVSLSVSPEDAVKVSREIRSFADERGVLQRVSYRVALCMEEMVVYATSSQKRAISMQVSVRFMHDSATFTILDDGECIALDEDREHQELITNNYDLVKCIAKEVDYQYILDLNYTVMRF